ncbi:MAG: hypothetical protein ACLFU9_07095 [Candidatus Bathyarchaeia archaeon]
MAKYRVRDRGVERLNSFFVFEEEKEISWLIGDNGEAAVSGGSWI